MNRFWVRWFTALGWFSVVTALGVVAFPGPAVAVEGSWAPTGSLNVPRQQTTSTLLADGRVLVAGGRNFALNDVLENAELYNPVTGTFSLTGSMANGRWSHTATRLADGRVLVAGGYTDPTSGANAQPVLNAAEVYNPATGTWTSTGPMSVRRSLHVAALLSNGRVLVAGGRTCPNPPPAACDFTQTTNSAEIYDPATNAWTPVAPMNRNRTTTSALRLNDGRVLVPAGFPCCTNTAETYNPATNAWTLTGNLSVLRARQGAMLLANGDALVAAGSTGQATLTSETYSPATNTWTPAGNVALTRFNYFFTELPNGKVLVAGGAGSPGASTTAEVYDPASRTWSSAGTLPNPHGSSSSNGNSTRINVLSGSQCGQHCGKVLLVGDNPNGAAELYTPASNFQCTTTITGNVGPVTVPAGSVTCINAPAQVNGTVTVQPGGSLVMNGARVANGVTSQGSTGVRICASQIATSTPTALSIVGTVGPVIVGDGTAACPRNDMLGPVLLDGNDRVEFDTNRIRGTVTVSNTVGSPLAPVVAANQITVNLDCFNNVPAPTNEGRPNAVIGARTGQCAGL